MQVQPEGDVGDGRFRKDLADQIYLSRFPLGERGVVGDKVAAYFSFGRFGHGFSPLQSGIGSPGCRRLHGRLSNRRF